MGRAEAGEEKQRPLSSLAQGRCPGKRPQTPLQAAALALGKVSVQDKGDVVSSPLLYKEVQRATVSQTLGLCGVHFLCNSLSFKRVAKRQGMQICFHRDPS